MAVDPICKMDVDESNPPGGKTDYQGATYYFCAPGCLKAFEADPEKYLSESYTGMAMDDPAPPRRSLFARIFGRGG